MWNARLAPWCPYAVKGVLFYQGCSNSWNAERYLSLQHALYDSWSEKFENGDLRFRYVQVIVELARAKELYVYSDDGTADSPFELAGADGTWHRATLQNVDRQGRLDGTRLVLKSADVLPR